MPVEIDLGMPPAGYALRAARGGETVTVQFSEFTSTEDGQHFIQRLEGFASDLLEKLPNPPKPSQVDSLLAVIRRDGKATVYLNEAIQKLLVRACNVPKKGDLVTKNDIVDIDRLELDVAIPDDSGVLFLFSVGWRKGLYYDFGPIGGPAPEPRSYDLLSLLGRAYCHVLFQERFSLSDVEWEQLFHHKWFPFAGLRHDTIESLVASTRAGWDPDEHLDQIVAEIKQRRSTIADAWCEHPSFLPHIDILTRALERFEADDFISCTGLLYPRIEGLMRTHHTSLGVASSPSPSNLAETAVASKIQNDKCLLLPHRFARYLQEIYFASFNPVSQDIEVSRHSVAHGVAKASLFDKKSAVVAILVAHQLFYFFDRRKPK